MFSPQLLKTFGRNIGIASLIFSASPLAHASLSGVVYENDTAYSGNADDGPSFNPGYYAGLASASFTSPAINYQSQVGGYTVGGFLNNPTFFNLQNGFDPNVTADNIFIELTGSIYLDAGNNSFVVAHDDGIVINIAGIGNVIDQPGPTGEDFSPFNVNAPSAGDYNVTVDYTECCGPPADLVWTINQQVVSVEAPDASSSLLLLCLGLAGLALASHRRTRKTA